ncbi:hypothetical protein [Flagellimonas algicola]|uniref:Uncharacterized protein n=1 Tax=Flagellimonas algicola TaxID=2583815 RepID=A0ABY2WNA3_9FLAO|nr:hypothetical protein [Allomuricauda algicola]TMU56478.1 hypothetical protein FGG15_02765 [Allomuricauda algicola]
MALLPYKGGYKPPSYMGPTSVGTKAPTKPGGGFLGLVSQVSGVANILGSIVGAKVISKTIGQALKDGFDCWGSTWTPTRAKKELPAWISHIGAKYKKSLEVYPDQMESSVNRFFQTFWSLNSVTGTKLEDWIGWRYTSAKDCTKRGLIALEKGIVGYMDELAANAVEIGPKIDRKVTVYKKTITLYRRQHGKVQPYKMSVPQIRVAKVKAAPAPVTKPKSGDPVFEDIKTKQPQQAGGTLIGLVALGLLLGKKFIK